MTHGQLQRFGDILERRKLLSFTLILFTLAVGIVIGTLVSTGADADRKGKAAPDATPLTVPAAVPVENQFSKIARKVRPSVVNIQVEFLPDREGRTREDRADEWFRRFFGMPNAPFEGNPRRRRRPRASEGSGVIVDAHGYVITNYHVIEDADRIRVRLMGDDNTLYDASVIGYDAETDLAVVKIDADRELTPATMGNSDAVSVGDWAIAVGSPFGFRETMTVGIISAKAREVGGINPSPFQKFLQTDAAINPGNSGGPLLNARGEVIGINTAIVSRTGGYEGLGFALPSNIAVDVYNQIIENGKVARGSIGIQFDGNQHPALLRSYGAKNGGVLVTKLEPRGGPADTAGMKPEDVIIEIDGRPVGNGDELIGVVASTAVGSTVEIVVLRDGERKSLDVKIADRDELFGYRLGTGRPRRGSTPETSEVMFGIVAADLTAEQRESLKFEAKGGVVVTSVEPASFADDIGVREQDVIVAINRKPVGGIDDIRAVQDTLKPGDDVALKIMRRIPGRSEATWITQYLAGVLPKAAP